jgi:hypothetical protein
MNGYGDPHVADCTWTSLAHGWPRTVNASQQLLEAGDRYSQSIVHFFDIRDYP